MKPTHYRYRDANCWPRASKMFALSLKFKDKIVKQSFCWDCGGLLVHVFVEKKNRI